MKLINIFCGQNDQLLNVKVGGTHKVLTTALRRVKKLIAAQLDNIFAALYEN
jgi:hypothetical protein